MTQLADELPVHLVSWLPQQRWFAVGREISLVQVTSSTALFTGEPAADLTVLGVEFADVEATQYFQLLVGRRRVLPSGLRDKAIGAVGDTVAYDGLWDQDVADWLLKELAESGSHNGVRFVREPDADVPSGLTSHVVSEERGNTSLVYDGECVLKLFRRLEPGANLDVELHRALRRAGNQHVAQLRAAIEVDWDGEPLTLGMLQDFVANPAAGWATAIVSVRDLLAERDLRADEVGGDFAGEAFRLGEAVAKVHADLAWALGTGEQDPSDVAAAMNARLSVAERAVPALAEYGLSIRAAYAELGGLDASLSAQRIHGDLDLHNILRTPTGWLLINFGGDAAKPLTDRVRQDSVLHDVAGMLRSFDEAARHQLMDWSQVAEQDSHLVRLADEWSDRNRSAFCDGYSEVAGADPRDQSAALLAYELDRVVYEGMYGAQDRPGWSDTLLDSIGRLTPQRRR